MAWGKKMIFLDTNVTIWAYQGIEGLLSPKVLKLFDEDDLVYSPMVKLELQYLYEIGKAKASAEKVLKQLYSSIGLVEHDYSFSKVIEHALHADWTREPFDRIITSHAQALDAILLTKDKVIRKAYKKAIW